jgi:hypothetical protein
MKIQIKTFDNKGNIKTISGFSKVKANWITKTNQWGDVLKTIMKTNK